MEVYKKITVGFVIQSFDENGKWLGQEFVAGDQVDYEDADGDDVGIADFPEHEYIPFDMIQPTEY